MITREYKAYPSLLGYAIIFPWLLPFVIGLVVISRMLFTGESNKVVIGAVFISIALAWYPFLLFWAMVVRTSLNLSGDGVVYRAVKFDPRNIFKSEPIEIRSPWGEVREVSWVGAPNAAMLIKTDHGVIKFWVMFHDQVNAEIMREILARAPHLQRRLG